MDNSTNPVNPLNVPRNRPKKLPTNVKAGLLIFLLASAVVLVAFPNMDHMRGSSPQFGIFLGSGLAVIIFTSLLFLYLSRLNLGFGKMALVLAFGFNAVIAVIKLIMSPHALYLASQKDGIADNFIDPNSAASSVIIALTILVLYIFIFKLIYEHFKRRLINRQMMLEGRTKPVRVKQEKSLPVKIVMIALVVICVAIVGILMIVAAVINPSVSYLGYVFGALGVPLVVAIVLGILLAYKGFAAVEKQVILTGNATLLASFFLARRVPYSSIPYYVANIYADPRAHMAVQYIFP